MHEYGVASAILGNLLDQLQREAVETVVRVRFVRSSAFSEAALRQTFDLLRAGTPLENAALVIDVLQLTVSCAECGHQASVTSDDLFGHIFVCPQCGHSRELAEAHELELVEVVAQASDTA